MPEKGRYERQQPGKPIRAQTINDPLDAIEAAMKLSVTAPLGSWQTRGGTVVYSQDPQKPFYAKITSGTSNGPYAWTEQIPQSGGGWTNGYSSGTSSQDPAYNTLAVTPSTLPVVVELRRDTLGILRFSIGSC